MKTRITIILISCSFIPLFAENQIRWDLGLNGLMLPALSDWGVEFDESITETRSDDLNVGGFMLPAGGVGLFGQFNFGKWRVGIGFQDISVCFIVNILYPAAYIEADAGPVTFNLQVGGGVIGIISLFGGFYLAGPYALPEASVWLRFSNKFRLGGGALVAIMPLIAEENIGKYLKDSSIFFFGFKYLIQNPWK
ncbi:MAG: hypothetical protein LBH75_08610 [Treponema sp.]|jgi:hypothetical protein|nr:hypothetical protein [Treponema sp.]